MKKTLSIALAALLAATAFSGASHALDERSEEELTCLPVNGAIRLPGIKYDDLTPLAHEVFRSNPAAVTNALYALPPAERDDFLDLYLEESAREKHRYFFNRCRDNFARQSAGTAMRDGVLPSALRKELRQRRAVRLALHEGAIQFRVGPRIVFIPTPDGYRMNDDDLVATVQEPGAAENRAFFGKKTPDGEGVEPSIAASLDIVRETSESLGSMLRAYRTMVDRDWRLVGASPDGSTATSVEAKEYRWNLEPFHVTERSFCYGQFEKVVDVHGVSVVKYRATAVIMLPSCFVQLSVVHSADTALEQVNEFNTDITLWRDAVLTANERYLDGR